MRKKQKCVWELLSTPQASQTRPAILPCDRMEKVYLSLKTQNSSQLENSEFPQNFQPAAPGQLLQGDEKQLELRKGTSLGWRHLVPLQVPLSLPVQHRFGVV